MNKHIDIMKKCKLHINFRCPKTSEFDLKVQYPMINLGLKYDDV